MIGIGLFGVFALAAICGGYPLAVRALGGLRRKRDGDRLEVIVGLDSKRGKAASHNAAVRHARRNELLVFSAAAQRFHSDAIPEHVAEFRNPRFGAAFGMRGRWDVVVLSLSFLVLFSERQ